jgi:hypothetical protein
MEPCLTLISLHLCFLSVACVSGKIITLEIEALQMAIQGRPMDTKLPRSG